MDHNIAGVGKEHDGRVSSTFSDLVDSLLDYSQLTGRIYAAFDIRTLTQGVRTGPGLGEVSIIVRIRDRFRIPNISK